MILDEFPSVEEFYKSYWGKKPFIVRGGVPRDVIDGFIDGDMLAGLSLEEDVRARIIVNSAAGDDWTCEHGPFDEDRFDGIGDENWSLLVQNVEQYHLETATLLKYFQFSPRWLLDDIMVSFSAPGGSVGPHKDSYHTFLVQGVGKRSWKISDAPVDDERYVDNPHVKVLAHGFEGESYEVEAGDVIYMPPFFGHEGKTIEAAMTFSVGFLGPKLSEMLGDFAQYLEGNEAINARYLGEGLAPQSAGFSIGAGAQGAIGARAIAAIGSDDFAHWMASYFARATHDDEDDDLDADDGGISQDDLQAAIEGGAVLFHAEHAKIAVNEATGGGFNIGVSGGVITISAAQCAMVEAMNAGGGIGYEDLKRSGDQSEMMAVLTMLYNKGVLYY